MSRNGTHCCVCIPTFSDIFHDDNAKYNAEKKSNHNQLCHMNDKTLLKVSKTNRNPICDISTSTTFN